VRFRQLTEKWLLGRAGVPCVPWWKSPITAEDSPTEAIPHACDAGEFAFEVRHGRCSLISE